MIDLEKIKKYFETKFSKYSDFILEKESQEYHACQFKLNDCSIHYRKAKITPKKEGLFVTFWKRISSGIIAPFDHRDDFQFLIVTVESERNSGHFIFPKSILIDQKIISTSCREGKRAFRIYPPWCLPKSKQAITSQEWQKSYFVDSKNSTSFVLQDLTCKL